MVCFSQWAAGQDSWHEVAIKELADSVGNLALTIDDINLPENLKDAPREMPVIARCSFLLSGGLVAVDDVNVLFYPLSNGGSPPALDLFPSFLSSVPESDTLTSIPKIIFGASYLYQRLIKIQTKSKFKPK